MEIQNLEGRMKYLKFQEEKKRTNFLFQSEIDSICASMLLSEYTIPLCKQVLWKAFDLVHGVCFPIS